MGAPDPQIDPNHETKRATLSAVGLGLLAFGVPCGLIGVGLFLSVFFADPFTFTSPARPALGIVLAAAGGFASIFGLQLLAAGNLGKLLRYQAGETFPVARDVTRHASPLAGEVARDLARAAREGWREADGPAEVRHDCGTVNDADDRFCKGCGRPIDVPRTCPSCGARNDPDARFCDRCGAAVTP